ncbi:flagellar hook-basal body complex protein [Clostridium algidicarnis]|uniref:Flagellar hook protein FlgE n=1 Tax=Clostridium algidicarnis TaxID=37659 RepID=A0ABS6BZ96_9CLOT|nr:flagellar hook-basal body complex protein [Clostridium algidicarnis]MBB6630458.1 flagellar hook-basal body complex protein [Clostridium algidicarnis]MBU3218558.1 flagellar hook-basal body complex protein [Clostridium algidicarnis]
MIRSMYSGISGMRVNQVKLDVIGNNIANSGTTGFKTQRVRFQDMISQNMGSASGPSRNLGGVNPRQVGLGVQLAGIDTVVSQGNMQPTARNLDVAVDGNGYFMVARGETTFVDGIRIYDTADPKDFQLPTDTKGLDIMFTRDGSFTLDHQGNLLNSDGLRVLGYSLIGSTDAKDKPEDVDAESMPVGGTGELNFVDADSKKLHASGDLRTLKIPETIKVTTAGGTEDKRITSFSIEKNGVIKATLEGGSKAVIGQIAMASFKNPAGLEKMGGNLLKSSPNSGNAIIRAGVIPKSENPDDLNPSNEAGYGDMLQGVLEMSNVDLAEQFTEMIVATRSFQANGKSISTGDEILQDIINLKR